ncbi:MAG: acetylglutamate kinase [Planctomycetes bacterium]|nr:acetylglutamate kinase [Planctomycetota bacterium]
MTTIIKIGGASGIIPDAICDDLRGRRAVVLVHGGSDATNRLSTQLGHPPRMVQSPSGQWSRLTDRTTLEIFAQATALQNRLLVERLQARGIPAIGLSGIDGRVVQAQRKESVRIVENGRIRIVRDQWTGRPSGVNRSLLRTLLGEGYLPVIAPIGCGARGERLNVDGDRVAAKIAAELRATRLLLMTNVPGLLADPEDPGSLIRSVRADALEPARAAAQGRMRKKVLAAEEALEAGVEQVVIASSNAASPVTDALAGQGTVFRQAAPRAAARELEA